MGIIYGFAAFFLVAAVAQTIAAIVQVLNSRSWRYGGNRTLLEDLVGAAFQWVIFGAFAYYIHYRRRTPDAKPRPYHARPEVRTVFKAFALLMFLGVPIQVFKHLNPPPASSTMFPTRDPLWTPDAVIAIVAALRGRDARRVGWTTAA